MKPKTKKRLLISLSVVALLVIAFSTMSAGIIKMIWGIRDPQVETRQTLFSTAARYGLDTTTIVTVDPSMYKTALAGFHKSFPEGQVFDKQGNYIEYKENDSACNAGLFGFIPTLTKNGVYNHTGKTTLASQLNMLRDINGKPISQTYLDPTADYYILISWAAFTGKLNKDHVAEWQNLAAKNTHARIQVIEVNFDPQKWWPKKYSDDMISHYKM